MSEDPQVGIVMGSDSDWPTMRAAAEALEEFGVPYEADVVSAHRMPEEMLAYGKDAAGRGLRVIIAGAGGAAHLPGMLAAVTPLHASVQAIATPATLVPSRSAMGRRPSSRARLRPSFGARKSGERRRQSSSGKARARASVKRSVSSPDCIGL